MSGILRLSGGIFRLGRGAIALALALAPALALTLASVCRGGGVARGGGGIVQTCLVGGNLVGSRWRSWRSCGCGGAPALAPALALTLAPALALASVCRGGGIARGGGGIVQTSLVGGLLGRVCLGTVRGIVVSGRALVGIARESGV